MQGTSEFARETWSARLRELSERHRGSPVALHGGGTDFGGLCTYLRSIGFDARTNVLEVAVGGSAGRGPALRCLVAAPERVVVEGHERRLYLLVQERKGPGLVVVFDEAGAAARSVRSHSRRALAKPGCPGRERRRAVWRSRFG